MTTCLESYGGHLDKEKYPHDSTLESPNVATMVQALIEFAEGKPLASDIIECVEIKNDKINGETAQIWHEESKDIFESYTEQSERAFKETQLKVYNGQGLLRGMASLRFMNQVSTVSGMYQASKYEDVLSWLESYPKLG